MESFPILVDFSKRVAQDAHPILALGSPAPNFELPGVDGKTHKLSDYAASPILVVVFTCNHCPIAQMYARAYGETGRGLQGPGRGCGGDSAQRSEGDPDR